MTDILSHIGAYKREEVAARKGVRSSADLEKAARDIDPPRPFRAALDQHHRPGRLALIAEVKKASPSKGLIRPDLHPAEVASAYERGGAACLSVLTDGPSFQGRDSDLTAARAATRLPCLRKEFIVDPWQVLESRVLGADAILIILALIDDSLAADAMALAHTLGLDVLVEVHDEAELNRAAALQAPMIGINNRDLRTFVTDLAVTERLAKAAPPSTLLVTESGIATAQDAARLESSGVKAMLVGESLMRQGDVETAVRDLLGGADAPA
jgi:indole-3-glycerol phosphate synthase